MVGEETYIRYGPKQLFAAITNYIIRFVCPLDSPIVCHGGACQHMNALLLCNRTYGTQIEGTSYTIVECLNPFVSTLFHDFHDGCSWILFSNPEGWRLPPLLQQNPPPSTPRVLWLHPHAQSHQSSSTLVLRAEHGQHQRGSTMSTVVGHLGAQGLFAKLPLDRFLDGEQPQTCPGPPPGEALIIHICTKIYQALHKFCRASMMGHCNMEGACHINAISSGLPEELLNLTSKARLLQTKGCQSGWLEHGGR